MLRNAVGGGWVSGFPKKKRYEGVRFNVINVTRVWVGVKFLGKKPYVTLELPPNTGVGRLSQDIVRSVYRLHA